LEALKEVNTIADQVAGKGRGLTKGTSKVNSDSAATESAKTSSVKEGKSAK